MTCQNSGLMYSCSGFSKLQYQTPSKAASLVSFKYPGLSVSAVQARFPGSTFASNQLPPNVLIR